MALKWVVALAITSASAVGRRPLNDKSARIAIIGAGPAGIHMASSLKKRGYYDVTVLERTQRVGGKSMSLYRGLGDDSTECTLTDSRPCITHEMGACYFSASYNRVRELVSDYGLQADIALTSREIFTDYSDGRPLSENEWISSEMYRAAAAGKIVLPDWVGSVEQSNAMLGAGLRVMLPIVDAVYRHISLQQEIFGDVEFAMPTRLPEASLARLDMSYSQFVEANNLEAMRAGLTFLYQVQGYGYLESVSAYYGLLWVTPEALRSFVQVSFADQLPTLEYVASTDPGLGQAMAPFLEQFRSLTMGKLADRVTGVLPEGFGQLWASMAAQDELQVEFGVEIMEIDRQLSDPNAPVKVTFAQEQNDITEIFDHLFYTAPHANAHLYIKDLTERERAIFGDLSSYVLATTLFKSNPVGSAVGRVNATALTEKDEGAWYADRFSAGTFGHEDSQTQLRVGYQFYEDPCSASDVLCDSDRFPVHAGGSSSRPDFFKPIASIATQLTESLQSQGISNFEIIEQFPWPYFHHFSVNGIVAGLPWDLLDLNIAGDSKTWWLGASACFESVNDVVNYNLMMLKLALGDTYVI